MINPNDPGKLGKINLTIPITVGFLGLIMSVVLTLLFYLSKTEDQKKTLSFLLTALGTSAGVTSAFYVGQSIKLNAESRRIEMTTSYISRWSDPAFDPVRKASHRIYEMVVQKPHNTHADIIHNALEQDLDLKLNLLDALNFLEEMALCIRLGIIDEVTAHAYYKSIVPKYCSTFGVWITRLRTDEKNDRLFKNLTELCDQWKNNH
jgi:hypothetical protein